VLIAQAEDDWVIPHSHSDVLFEAFLAPLLPNIAIPKQPLSLTTEQWNDLAHQQEHRSQKRKEIVETSVVSKFGTVSRIGTGRSVTLVKTLVGGHDNVVEQEGLQDIIARDFELL
jgi:abhydrolase domain-containing protein 12